MKKILLILLCVLLITNLTYAQNVYITKGKYLAAWTKEDFDLLVKRTEDVEAVKKMATQGKVFAVKKGVVVYLEDSTWTGAVKLRPKGETYTFWTFMEEIK